MKSLIICSASSTVGTMRIACGNFSLIFIRHSIPNTYEVVFPLPDTPWPMKSCMESLNMIGNAVTWIWKRCIDLIKNHRFSGCATYLKFRWFIETGCLETTNKIRMTESNQRKKCIHECTLNRQLTCSNPRMALYPMIMESNHYCSYPLRMLFLINGWSSSSPSVLVYVLVSVKPSY